MNKVIKITLAVIGILLVIFGMWGIISASIDFENGKMKCIEEYGGQIETGYCIYIKDGNSQSYKMLNHDAKGRLSE